MGVSRTRSVGEEDTVCLEQATRDLACWDSQIEQLEAVRSSVEAGCDRIDNHLLQLEEKVSQDAQALCDALVDRLSKPQLDWRCVWTPF